MQRSVEKRERERERRLCHGMRSFHLHSAVDIQPFSPAFPLAGYAAKASCCYSFGASKKAVLKFPADTAIRGRSSAPVSAEHSLPWRRPHFQRGERFPPATADGASSRVASPLSTALRGTFGRSSPPSCRIAMRRGTSSKFADARASGG